MPYDPEEPRPPSEREREDETERLLRDTHRELRGDGRHPGVVRPRDVPRPARGRRPHVEVFDGGLARGERARTDPLAPPAPPGQQAPPGPPPISGTQWRAEREAGPHGRAPQRQDPSYWAWSAGLFVGLVVASLVAVFAALLVGAATPVAGAAAWPWALVGVGGMIAGSAILWSAWPRSPRDYSAARAVAGVIGGLLLAFGLLSVLWFARLLAG